MAEAKYACSLSEKSIRKANEELHEEPDERLSTVQSLREWIEREPWITSPTDTRFLLSFLRWAKFSQLSARERLGNFLASITGSYSFMLGHDPGDPKSLEILRGGSIMILPGKDKEGRHICFGKIGAIDTSGYYSYEDFTKAFMAMIHSLIFFNEEAQVNGVNYFMDFGGVTMSLMTWTGMDGAAKAGEYANKSLPVRIKGINYYNTGPVFEAFIAIFKPVLAEKIRKRVNVHHTMVSVYEQIDLSCLPEEYLPDEYKGPSAGTIKDIVEDNIKEFLLDPVKRTFLKELYSGTYTADIKKRPKEAEAMASFRKLNVS